MAIPRRRPEISQARANRQIPAWRPPGLCAQGPAELNFRPRPRQVAPCPTHSASPPPAPIRELLVPRLRCDYIRIGLSGSATRTHGNLRRSGTAPGPGPLSPHQWDAPPPVRGQPRSEHLVAARLGVRPGEARTSLPAIASSSLRLQRAINPDGDQMRLSATECDDLIENVRSSSYARAIE